jgi:hypothetical protein
MSNDATIKIGDKEFKGIHVSQLEFKTNNYKKDVIFQNRDGSISIVPMIIDWKPLEEITGVKQVEFESVKGIIFKDQI